MTSHGQASAPIFIFSVSWRTGSTFLQRTVIQAGALVWGEPGGALNHLETAYRLYEQMAGPGNVRYEYGYGGGGDAQFESFRDNPEKGSETWVANITPPVEERQEAFRSFFHRLYGEPAQRLGFTRWGVKEVRADAKVARFIQSLYPDAKFVILNRHPIPTLLSIKRRGWMDQDERALPVLYYARHWNRLAIDLMGIENALHVRYEDLRDPQTIQRLSQHLDMELQPDFQKRVDWNEENRSQLNPLEKRIIGQVTREGRTLWGYGDSP